MTCLDHCVGNEPCMSAETDVGVIFDMDGVLIDSAQAHFESWRVLAAECNVEVTRAQFEATFGRRNPEIIPTQKEVDILKLEVQSVVALKEGDGDKAVTMAREAAEMQASLPFRYGPPRISKPTAELLGDILYDLGNNAGAILAYKDQLSRSKLRTNSLIGLARAAARIGDNTTSLEAYGSLANIWHSADESVTGLAEVRRNTRRN